MKFAILALSFCALASAKPSQLRDRRINFPELIGHGRPAAAASSTRITQGTEAEPGSHPSIVNLMIGAGGFCGGSLIAPDVVLTAAHCTDGARTVTVTAGAHQLKPMATCKADQSNEQSQVVDTPAQIIVHPGWSRVDVNNDISLIKLNQPFELNDFVQVIDLAKVEPAVGEMTDIAGWGKMEGGILQGVAACLQEADAPVVSDKVAAALFGAEMDWSTKICIDSSDGGVCSGDSGGPLVTSATGDLVGITSFGALGCNPGTPSCFTSVPSYLDWIRENM